MIWVVLFHTIIFLLFWLTNLSFQQGLTLFWPTLPG